VTPRLRASLIALAAPLLAASVLAAAPITVLLRVQGAGGAPLAGAAIEITAAATEQEQAFSISGTSDAEGTWTTDLPDNRRVFQVEVSADGHQTLTSPLDLKGKRGSRNRPFEVPAQLVALTAADYYNQGVEQLQANKFDAAAPFFQKAVGLDPSLALGWRVLAMVQMERGQHAAALEAADRALALDAADVAALRTRYEALAALGRPESEAALDAIFAKDKSADAARLLFNSGAQAGNTGDSERARKRLGQALELDPKLWQAHTALAEVAIREKNFDEALAALDRAIEIAPRNFKARERRIEILQQMGRAEDATAARAELDRLKSGG
jgi:tetratricopeptide (TPR) repeat protein